MSTNAIRYWLPLDFSNVKLYIQLPEKIVHEVSASIYMHDVLTLSIYRIGTSVRVWTRKCVRASFFVCVCVSEFKSFLAHNFLLHQPLDYSTQQAMSHKRTQQNTRIFFSGERNLSESLLRLTCNFLFAFAHFIGILPGIFAFGFGCLFLRVRFVYLLNKASTGHVDKHFFSLLSYNNFECFRLWADACHYAYCRFLSVNRGQVFFNPMAKL